MFIQRNLLSHDNQELLFSGCRELDIEKVKKAIAAGADVNKKSPTRLADEYIYSFNAWFSPLSLVAKAHLPNLTDKDIDARAKEITSILLQYGANVDLLDKGDMGNSALHWSIIKRKNQLSLLLISHAVANNKQVINLANNPEEPSFGKNTPLILGFKIAIASLLKNNEYDLDIVNALIYSGADVTQKDSNEQSALHWACMLRAPERVFELLSSHHCTQSLNAFGQLPCELYETHLSYDMLHENPTAFNDIDHHLPDWHLLNSKEDRAIRKNHRDKFIQKRNQIYDQNCLNILNTCSTGLKRRY